MDDPEAETGVGEIGACVVVLVRVVVTDGYDSGATLRPLITVHPGEEHSVQGRAHELEVRLHLADGESSQVKTITARSEDSSGNTAEHQIEVTVTASAEAMPRRSSRSR